MTMSIEDGFKMLKRQVNPEPKKRMYFWYGHEQAMLLDKTKVAQGDIKAALSGKPPKPPFCYGRLGLHDGKEGGQELRVVVAGAIPSKLAKDLKLEAAKHGLRGIEVVVDDGLDEDAEENAEGAAGKATNANRQRLGEAIKALLQKKPGLKESVESWLQTNDDTEAMSSDEVDRAIDELSKLEAKRDVRPDGSDVYQAKVTAAASRARDRHPEQGKQIAELVRSGLAAFADKKAKEAMKALEAIEAIWNQDVTAKGGGGGGFEQALLSAAKEARVQNPTEATKIAELVQRGREQSALRTEAGDKRAKEALEQLKLLALASDNLREAKRAANAALTRLRDSVNSSISKGMLGSSRTQEMEPMHKSAADAEKAIERGDYEAAIKLAAQGEKLLRELELTRQDGLGRQESQAKIETAQKEHDRVQQHVDKVKDKRGGLMSDYREGTELGAGANGKVSEIVSKSGGPTLVMKTPTKLEDLDGVRGELTHEAQMAENVGAHPNIAQCFGVVEIGGTPRLLMEKIDGGDMRSMNKNLMDKRNSGEISEEEYWGTVQFTFGKMLEALAHVSEKGYVHGDIKPENVMIDSKTGEPKLIDLGSMQKKGDRAGDDTSAYRTPEWSPKATTGTDSFATGSTMWETSQGNDGKNLEKMFDYGGSDVQSFRNKAWEQENSATPNDPSTIPLEWRQLATPAVRVGDNSDPVKKAFTTTVTTDKDTGLQSSKNEKKLGVYAADTAYVDFLNRLMHPNPAARMSPAEALAHPFMRDRLLDDDKARAVVQGTVAPVEGDDTPFGKQVSALGKATSEGRKEHEAAADRALKVDKLAQAVESEAAGLRSGKGKANPALAGDKLQPMLDDGGRRLGSLADRAQALRSGASELEGPEGKAPNTEAKDKKRVASSKTTREAAEAAAKSIDDARQSLHGAVTRLDKAVKDRATIGVKV